MKQFEQEKEKSDENILPIDKKNINIFDKAKAFAEMLFYPLYKNKNSVIDELNFEKNTVSALTMSILSILGCLLRIISISLIISIVMVIFKYGFNIFYISFILIAIFVLLFGGILAKASDAIDNIKDTSRLYGFSSIIIAFTALITSIISCISIFK